MEIVSTHIADVLLIKPKIWGDARGYFVETWQKSRYEAAGIRQDFVQDNLSRSTYGVLRGLHFQKTRPQGKLVRVSLGSVYDVIVDIRKNSSTYGKYVGIMLTEENQWQVWVPPGLAHGFVVTSDVAHFNYKVTDFYFPDDEGCLRWDDAALGIAWPVAEPVVSAKDASGQGFGEEVGV